MEKEVRLTKEHVSKISGRRDAQGGTQLTLNYPAGTGKSQIERDCQWSMLCTRVKMHKSSKSPLPFNYTLYGYLLQYEISRKYLSCTLTSDLN